MRIHIVQQVSYEGPGHIATWAANKGHAVRRTKLFEGEALPDVEEFDWLVILGGPMGVHDGDIYPQLIAQRKLIENAVNFGKRALGICLGAQLIAQVLGAEVKRNAHVERGWHTISLLPEAASSTAFRGLPQKFDAILWHGDTFGIPREAKRLALSTACENQAFEYQGRVVGLQFHLEVKPPDVYDLIENSAAAEGPHVQATDEIVARMAQTRVINALMDGFLANMEEVC